MQSPAPGTNGNPNPYRAPDANVGPPVQGTRPYRSLLPDVRPLRIALYGCGVLAAAGAGEELFGFLVGALESDGSGASAVAATVFVAAAVIWYVVTIILFARFLVRANHNARSFALRPVSYSAASMVWWFFVPIANFFAPFNAVKNVFEASDVTPQATSLPRYANIWWGAWVVTNITDNASMRVDDTSAALLTGIAMAGAVSTTLAAYFGSKLTQELALRQHETAQKLGLTT